MSTDQPTGEGRRLAYNPLIFTAASRQHHKIPEDFCTLIKAWQRLALWLGAPVMMYLFLLIDTGE